MYEKILITGSSGLVGSSLVSNLRKNQSIELLLPSHKDLDLLKEDQIDDFFNKFKPDLVVNLAAKVGGILDNKEKPIQFFSENLIIGMNLYKYSAKYGVKKIINIGAGCGYPLKLIEPLKEENFWDGRPQEESIGYSTAKKMHLLMGEMYQKEYGIISTTFIPSNLFGKFDNFNLQMAHVVPALIHKIYLAKKNGSKFVNVWGDGTASRDFLYVEDFTKILMKSFEWEDSQVLNVATGYQTSIKDLVNIIKDKLKFEGDIIWQSHMPSGQKSRSMDISKLIKKYDSWNPSPLNDSIEETINWFQDNYEKKNIIRI